MGKVLSTVSFTLKVFRGIFSRIIFGWNPIAWKGDSANDTNNSISKASFAEDAKLISVLKEQVFTQQNLDKLSDEQLVKICRQIEFWYSGNGGNWENDQPIEEIVKLASNLVDQSLWYQNKETLVRVPKVRFGKTELQMPVVTCGGMRLQSTWLPDSIPLLAPSRKTVLSSPTQSNIKNCVRACLALGINHFETARMYGTSEYQMVEALHELIQEGAVKREDIIFQTKVVAQPGKKFRQTFQASWKNIEEKIGYIDLFSLHGIHKMDNAVMESLEVCEEFKKEGKIHHIGFSTHGTADQIMDLINSEKFDYINLHYHYFGSYHGSGTMDGNGGEGNLGCVKRALELDMGVFQISPFDKGGKVYRPSKDVALAVGKELTPVEFVALYAWKKGGIHTSSVGIARPSDLDEVMSAARVMALGHKHGVDVDTLLNGCIDRLQSMFEEKVGKEWAEKGLLNVPTCYDESTDGIGVGHILWIHDMLTGYGLYEFCKDRYLSLESNSWWNKKKSFEENIKKMPGINSGREFDDSVDLSKALANHYNPELAMKKIKEAHRWLSTKEIPESGFTDQQLTQMGFPKGYNLTVWTENPGELDSTKVHLVLLQALTGGRMGVVSGPGYSFQKEVELIRATLSHE